MALTASFNVWLCYDNHDKCRSTTEFSAPGQNLYNYCNSRDLPVSEVITNCVKKWFDESKVTTADHIKKFPLDSEKIGHFTQITKYDACFVGCAGAKWKDGIKNCGYVVCNYSNSNSLGDPIYEEGKPASGCVKGPHRKYSGLCASLEKFDQTTPSPVKKLKRKDAQFHFKRNQ